MKIEEYKILSTLEKQLYFENSGRTDKPKNRLVFDKGFNNVSFRVVTKLDDVRINSPSYALWKNIFSRCYNKQYHDKFPTYVGCSVAEDWLHFSNFNDWWKENYKEGCVLDKDILHPENKIYSENTCIFVPAWINGFVTSCQNKRGKYLLGVSWRKDLEKFMATCCVNGTNKNIGHFDCEVEAHQAWLSFKLSLIEKRKEEIDNVDPRLYDAIINKIKSLS